MVRKKLLLGLDVREVSLDDDGDELFERNAPRLGDAHELRPLFGFEVSSTMVVSGDISGSEITR